MQAALPSVATVLALLLPSLLVGAQAPQPDLQTPLAAPTEATGQVLQQALAATDALANPAFAAAFASLDRIQRDLQSCVALGPCSIAVEQLFATAADVAAAGVGTGMDQGAALVALGALWAQAGAGSAGTLADFAGHTAGIAVDETGPNDQVIIVTPHGSVPGTADLAGGFYRFDIDTRNQFGQPVPLGDWRLDVLGLQVLPGSRPLDVPGLAQLEPPAAALTLLYSVTASQADPAQLAPCATDVATCLSIAVPAGPLKLERLYAGSQVFLRFSSGNDPDPATFPSDVGFHNVLVTQAAAGGLNTQDLNTWALLDQLDQFPTAVVLAPQVLNATSPDPDLDGWDTTVELALNSDPLDQASVPGSDDDLDGLLNYLEGSRFDAALPDDLNEVEALRQRIPLQGKAFVHSTIAPPAVHFVPGELTQTEVADFGVAGPPAFTLTGLRLENTGDLIARAGAELQRFSLRLDGPEPTEVAAWRYDGEANLWVLEPPFAHLTLTCVTACDGGAANWTLGGLALPAEHALRFRLVLQIGNVGVNAAALDGKTFRVALDPQSITLTSPDLVPPGAVGPEEFGPVFDVEVEADRIRVESQNFLGLRAGEAASFFFAAVDAFGNRDLDETRALTFALLGDGAASSPTGIPPTFTATAPMVAGLAGADATLVLAHAAATLRATHAALGTAEGTPFLVDVDVPVAPVVEQPAAGLTPRLADDPRLEVQYLIEDRFGNDHGANVPVLLQVTKQADGTIQEIPLNTAADGRVAHTLALGTVAGNVFDIVALAAGKTSEARQARVDPGVLKVLRIVDAADPATQVESVVRAIRVAGTAPVATLDLADLRVEALDNFGNLKPGFQGVQWARGAGFAPELAVAPGDAARAQLTSLVGAIAGEVCVQSIAETLNVSDCVAASFRGRAPPVVDLGCGKTLPAATTGDAYTACVRITDDVQVTSRKVTATLPSGAVLDLPLVPGAAPGEFTVTIPAAQMPANTIADLVLHAEARDDDGEARPATNGVPLLGAPLLGGLTAPPDLPVDVLDDDAPMLDAIVLGQPNVTAEVPFITPATPVTFRARDNVELGSIRAHFNDAADTTGLLLENNTRGVVSLTATGLTGLATASVTATDAALNDATDAWDLFVDGEAPQLALTVNGIQVPGGTAPDAPFVVPRGATIRLTAVDRPLGGVGVDEVGYTVYSQSGALLQERDLEGSAATLLPPGGLVQVAIRATDLLGNAEGVELPRIWLDVDELPPVLTAVQPLDATILKALAQVRLDIADNGPLDPANLPTLTLQRAGGEAVPLVPVVTATSASSLRVTAALPALLDGNYTLRAAARDAGGLDGFLNWTFTFDTVAPVPVIQLPEEGFLAGIAPVALVVSATDTVTPADKLLVKCQVDAGPFATCPASLDLAHGPHQVVLSATDQAGNTKTVTRSFEVDRVLPEVGLQPMQPFQPSRTFPLLLDATDAHLVEVSFQRLVDGAWTTLHTANVTGLSPVSGLAHAFTSDVPDNTFLTFRAVARDAAGNIREGAPVQTKTDTTFPLARLDPLPAHVRGDVAILGQAGVPGQVIQGWVLEAAPSASGPFTVLAQDGKPSLPGVPLAVWKTGSGFLADGPRVLRLRVTTISGAVNETPLLPVTIDNTAPTVTTIQSLSGHGAAWSKAAQVVLAWTAADNMVPASGLAVSCTIVPPSPVVQVCGPNGATFTAPPGLSTFSLAITDTAGNSATVQPFQLRVDTAAPAISGVTIAGVTSGPGRVRDGEQARLGATVRDLPAGAAGSGLTSVRALVQHAGATVEVPLGGSGESVSALLGPFGFGAITYQLVARDGAGNEARTAPATLAVEDRTPPTLRLLQPSATKLAAAIPVVAELADAGSGVATFTARLLDAAGAEVVASTVPATAGTFTLPQPLSIAGRPNGEYTLVVEARDAADNLATSRRALTLAVEPVLGAAQAAVAGADVTISFAASGTPALKVWLYPTVRGTVLNKTQVALGPNGVYEAKLTAAQHGLAPGDVVSYFIEARDGPVSLRSPVEGVHTVEIPIPVEELTDLAAWKNASLASVTETPVNQSEDHRYVEISRGQFTHDLTTATFAFQLNGAFPTNPAVIPKYRVEFDLTGTPDPEVVLQATYPGGDPAANGAWTGTALRGDGSTISGVTVTVVPNPAGNALAMQVPVTQLASAFGANAGGAEARFVAQGSLVQTTFAPFDIVAPQPVVTPPATLTDTTPLSVTLAAVDNQPLTQATATLEVTLNQQLVVLPVPIVDGVLQPPSLAGIALVPGTLSMALTVVDRAGNVGATAPISQLIQDVTAPTVGAVLLGGTALDGTVRQVPLGAELPLVASLTDTGGLPSGTVALGGATQPLHAVGDAFGATLRFPTPGPATIVLRALDLANNVVTREFPVLVLDASPPVPGALTLRGADGAILDHVEAGAAATLSLAVSDDSPLGLVQASAVVAPATGAPCTLTLTRQADDAFTAPLACPGGLSLGPVVVAVTVVDSNPANVVLVPAVTFLHDDTVAPHLADPGLPAGFNDAEATSVRFTVLATEAGRLVGLQAVLEQPATGVQHVLTVPQVANQAHRLSMPPLLPGNYKLTLTATDVHFDGAAPALRTVTLERTFLVDDALGPDFTLLPGSPTPGKVTPTEQVTFAGIVLDAGGVPRESVALLVDGVAAVADATSPGLSLVATPPGVKTGWQFSYTTTLAKGRHVFTFRATDPAGNPLLREFGFYVVDPPVFALPTPAATVPAVAPNTPAAPGQGGLAAPAAGTTTQPLVAPAPLPPPVQASVPVLDAEGAQAVIILESAAATVTALAVSAEAPVAAAQVVARDLGEAEALPANFDVLYRQVEINVLQDGAPAPLVLDHIDFRVPRSFVAAAGVDADQAALLHYEDGAWASRDTILVDQDASYYHYRAIHGGRSTFAIVFDRAPPVVTLVAPTVASLQGMAVEALARDDTAVKELTVTLDGATIGSGAPLLRLFIDPSTLAQVASGALELVAIAKDATGKTAQVVQRVTLEQPSLEGVCLDPGSDTLAPITTVSWRGGDAAIFGDILGIKGPVAAVFSAVDQGPDDCRDRVIPEVRYRVDDGPLLGGLTVELRADAPHTLEFFAVDSRGNEEAHRIIRIVPAEGADQGELPPPEPLEVQDKKSPGFEVLLVAGALLLAGLARRRRRA